MKEITNEREFDLIVFGASAFTGKYTVEYMANNNDELKLKWAIAGRNHTKLLQVLEEVSSITGKDVKSIPIIIADVSDPRSLTEMCRKTKLILNIAGPYLRNGEPVVEACIDNKTHHLDLSGEPIYLEGMQLKYDEEAKKSGVYIMGATGFDSVPCETGIQRLREKFDGDLNSVESFVEFVTGSSGMKMNSGTWKSFIFGLRSEKKVKPIRRQIFSRPYPVPDPLHRLKSRFPLSYNSKLKKWCVTFPITDQSVVYRTNHFNYNYHQMRPVQMFTYMVLPTLLLLIPFFFLAIYFGIFSLFGCGRRFMAKHPSCFSFGVFSNNGPSRKQVEETSFKMHLFGEGYESRITDPKMPHQDPPKKRLILTVEGPETAYAATPICMVSCAVTLLEEIDKLPNNGGVLTCGAAFKDTTLINRLEKAGIKYTFWDK
ncbi:hypothetical protein CHUAL_009319 [Chamberlinius hualienensis]